MTFEPSTDATNAALPTAEPDDTDGAAVPDEVEDEGGVANLGGDDMSLAAAFMRSLDDAGRLVRYSTKDLLWEYDHDRGVWRRFTESDMRAFNAALYEFVRDRLPANHRNDRSTSRYRSVRRVLFDTLGDYHVAPDEFDVDSNLIAFRNGVYDLERDVLLPHDPSHMLTSTRDYDHDPKATCPRFVRFLEEVLVRRLDPTDETSPLVPDRQLWLLVQEMMGYSFATHCRAEKVFFMYGDGRNGKSALIRVLCQVVGEHNVCDFDVREIGNSQMNDRLIGKLVAVQTELDAGTTIPDARLKAMASGEGMTAKVVYEKVVSFHPFATLIMAGNNLPTTRDRSKGFWARTVVIPFLATFEGDAADANLQDRFLPELAGVSNFAAEGYRRLRDNGWRFTEAATSVQATLRYREETDSVLSWFDDSLRAATATIKVQTADLFDSYSEYCRRFRFAADNLTRFSKRIRQIVDAREGQAWSTAADGGTPFSMAFHRAASSRGYVGTFQLVSEP